MTVGCQDNDVDLRASSVTVSQLNQAVRHMLETKFESLWVRGELSSFTSASSGHWYFTIKDDQASVRAVMFRQRALATLFNPKVGDAVEIRCRPTLYEARGEFQLQVEQMRKAGQGDLFEAFLALKSKLAAEGLFAAENKRVLAKYPRSIGVITSLAAAALHDVLTSLARRAPHVSVVVYPASVQGAEAPLQLRQALAIANERAEVDTILLVRGGGSLEDLWAYNDELLARDIASSVIPVVSGVGHETDFTIADFVADLRAPTPTAAAELVCIGRDVLMKGLQQVVYSFTRAQTRYFELLWQRLDRSKMGLISPSERLAQQRIVVNNLHMRLSAIVNKNYYQFEVKYQKVQERLKYCLPTLDLKRERLDRANQALFASLNRQIKLKRASLESLVGHLRALSPNHVLERGYSIIRGKDGLIIRSYLDAQPNDVLKVTVADGDFTVTVSSDTI
jgi:exodeoxyribonuclease VII large subunit